MNDTPERKIQGSSVSRGVAYGPAVCLYGRNRQFYRIELSGSQVEKEIRRLRAAVRLGLRQLNALKKRNGAAGNDHAAGILDVHRMILTDKALLDSIEKTIVDDQINAEWAVKMVTDSRVLELKSIGDERLSERHIDFEDVTSRIQSALGGERHLPTKLERGSIAVARVLNPSTLIELADSGISGIATEHGGWTSHTYILARELGIPAVTGTTNLLRLTCSGALILVDGYRGQVVVNPSDQTRSKAGDLKTADRDTPSKVSRFNDVRTLDGRAIKILANADVAGGYERAVLEGASGVGLFRTEYAFNRFKGLPDESEQFEVYRNVAGTAGKDGVRIRTFDIGNDAGLNARSEENANPALGLRAIRASLEHETDFRTQLRALLRASSYGKIDIILPMISDIVEVTRARQILDEERSALIGSNIPIGEPRLGVMVEVPSLIFVIERLVELVDIVCLGTNDLVQYLLAVDRDNEAVAKWYNTLNPAVLRAIRAVVEATSARGISCIVCGEMAGSPFYVPILIGLGATELSMNPASISQVRRTISNIAFEETLSLVAEVQKCSTAVDAERTAVEFMRANWKHFYPASTTGGHSESSQHSV